MSDLDKVKDNQNRTEKTMNKANVGCWLWDTSAGWAGINWNEEIPRKKDTASHSFPKW